MTIFNDPIFQMNMGGKINAIWSDCYGMIIVDHPFNSVSARIEKPVNHVTGEVCEQNCGIKFIGCSLVTMEANKNQNLYNWATSPSVPYPGLTRTLPDPTPCISHIDYTGAESSSLFTSPNKITCDECKGW